MLRHWKHFPFDDNIVHKLVLWVDQYDHGTCYIGDGWGHKNQSCFKAMAGVGVHQNFKGSISDVQSFLDASNDYVFTRIGYDLKNELEHLPPPKSASISFDTISLYIPAVLVIAKNAELRIGIRDESIHDCTHQDIYDSIMKLENEPLTFEIDNPKFNWPKAEYLKKIERTKAFIQQGEIYQANICQEVNWATSRFHPSAAFNTGFKTNPNPFSVYLKEGPQHILSWSPERFISMHGQTLLSQPMKGTAPRGETIEEDNRNKQRLSTSEKDRRENVMIVDMVRNDLSHFAAKNSVQVEDLYAIESYPKVHQMYSTVVAKLKEGAGPFNALLKAFPMGSMTGAPKIRAMEIIDELEVNSRGMFSGSIGYISPDGKADFNVVIRTLIYDQKQGMLSAHVGGGITALSNANEEYEECMVKLAPIRKLLKDLGG